MKRTGFALPLVVALLALGGMLVTASFLLGRLESQSGDNGFRAARAFEAAETGLASTLENWGAAWDTLTVGDSALASSAAVATSSWQTTIERLGEDLFVLRSEGRAAVPGAPWPSTRRLSLLVRWLPSLPRAAALTVIDSLNWIGQGAVSGYSNAGQPAGWPGCLPDSAPGIRLPPPAIVSQAGCPGSSCFSGKPPLLVDSSLTPAVSTALLPLNYDSLVARSIPVSSGTLNDTTSFPVLHSVGDLSLSGGIGQGILLVDGELSLSGGVEFYGLVVALGGLTVGAGGGHLTGAAILQALQVPSIASLRVDYSACVLRKVLRGPTRAIPLQYRSWAQLY
jgi:hypothetical protein